MPPIPHPSRVKIFFRLFREDDLGHHAAATAYYALFAVAPFAVALVAVSNRFFGSSLTDTYLVTYLAGRFGSDIVSFTDRFFTSVSEHALNSYFAVLGILIFLYAVIKFFEEIRKIFFRIFKLRMHEKNIIKRTFRQRLVASIFMIISIALLLIFMTANIVFSAIGHLISEWSLMFLPMFNILQFLFLFVLSVMLFTVMYRVGSSGAVSRKAAAYGGLAAGLGIVIVNMLFSGYLKLSVALPAYGAAGFLIALMLWLYYGSLIIFSGAEIAKISDQG